MSTQELRDAAALMRKRAEASTGATHHWDSIPAGVGVGRVFCGQVFVAKTDETLGGQHANANYIAAMHPAVALAVADWLEQHSNQHASAGRDECLWTDEACGALAVARAYLGTPA